MVRYSYAVGTTSRYLSTLG